MILTHITFLRYNSITSNFSSEGELMVEFKPEPRKNVFLAVAVTPEMKTELKDKVEGLNMSVSELMRVLAQKFLNGEFDGIEQVQPRKTSTKSKKRGNKPHKIGGNS